MKYYDWNKEKNRLLKAERDISFEEVYIAIESGGLLDIVKHPNQKKYPNQKMFVLNINNYVYLVPFVEDEEKVFLKTIIPSRKATKKYIVKGGGKK
ncbi:MAG: toxin [Candidatus Microgenomates bacterium]